jgi:hypothetical protein
MDVTRATEIVVIMLSPSLAVGAALYAPRVVRAALRLVRRGDRVERPDHPPIEQLAADLRRLLGQHETLKRSTDIAMRVQHLRAVEAAIADCALDAAHALGVSCPQRPAHGALTTPQLRGLLRVLADDGLVLPPAVSLLAGDRRL